MYGATFAVANNICKRLLRDSQRWRTLVESANRKLLTTDWGTEYGKYYAVRIACFFFVVAIVAG